MPPVVVRDSSGRVKSVVSGGRQYAYGSKGYEKNVSQAEKRQVEAKRSGRATIVQSQAGTSVYEGEPGQGGQQVVNTPQRVVPSNAQVTGIQKTQGGYQVFMQTKAAQTKQNTPQAPYRQPVVGRPNMPSDWLVSGIDQRNQYIQSYRVPQEQTYFKQTLPVSTSPTSLMAPSLKKDLFPTYKPTYTYTAGKADVIPFNPVVQAEVSNVKSFKGESLVFLYASGTAGIETAKSFSPYDKGFKVPDIIPGTFTTFMHPVKTVEDVQTGFKTSPTKTAGSLFGTSVATAGMLKGINIAGSIGRNVRIYAARPEYVPAEKVFAPEVLSGEQVFPTQKGVSDALKQFRSAKSESGKLLGTHTTDISPMFKAKEIKIEAGAAGKLLKEDPVLYIAPGGRGSAYFTRLLGKDVYDYKFSLNPFKQTKPAAINIEYADIGTLPKSVVKSKGYGAVGTYLKGQVGTGKAFITKRSIVSTSEVEAGIPETSLIVQKGASIPKYTSIGSRWKIWRPLVPIKEFYLFKNVKSRSGGVSENYGVVDVAMSSSRRYRYVEPYSMFPSLSSGYSGVSSGKPYSYRGSSVIYGGSYKYGSSRSFSSSSSSVSKYSSSIPYRYSSSKLGSSNGLSRSSYSYSASSSSISSSRSGSSGGFSSIRPSSIVPPPPNYSDSYSRKKKYKNKSLLKFKSVKRRGRLASFVVLPDLLSVWQTESKGKGEAISPILTRGVRRSFMSGVRGYSAGFRIPTLQMQRRGRKR